MTALPLRVLTLLGLALASAPAASLTRGPYLQKGTPSAVTVRWRTDVATASHVTFGPSPTNQPGLVASAVATTEHELTLSALTPGTAYFYTIGDGTAALAGGDAAHTFRTAPPLGAAAPVHVWVLGDSGTGGNGSGSAESVRDAYVASPLFAHNDVWLMLGDNAYGSGTDAEYQQAVFDTYPALLRDSVLWSTLGNHETYDDPDHPPYFDIFTLPRFGEAGGTASGTEHYYAFDYANVHFVCLDSMQSARTPGSPMLQWLADDLASTGQRWIIAYWHHPPYSKGSHNSDSEGELIEMRANVLPILEAGGVDLVLGGHSHAYERSKFIDGHYGLSPTLAPAMVKDGGDGREDGTGAYGKDSVLHAGAVYVVAGSSGQTGGGALNHPVMFTSMHQLGSLVLDVKGDRLDARFLNSAGVVADHFTISKEPLVTLTAAAPAAAEMGARPGRVTFARTQGLGQAVTVAFTLGGSASAGLDYLPLSMPLTIPAGAASVTLAVQPLGDTLAEGAESVTLTALPGAHYRLRLAEQSATVTIEDLPLDNWRFEKFGDDANNPGIAGDTADPDGDGHDNVHEYLAGTEPQDGASFFQATAERAPGGPFTVRFTAQPGHTYSVFYKNTLTATTWRKLTDIAAESAAREVAVADPGAGAQRFYRVVTPVP